MDNLRGIESFVKAVETGSIAAAARLLGISAAAASQNIARLESQLGTRLLTRTTRSLRLTDSGELYYNRVHSLINELENAKDAVTALSGEPQGRLCIASTAAFGRHVLAALAPAFNRRYPRIALEIITTDRSVNHIQEMVDVSIRIKQQLEEGLVARRIAAIPLIFCASPAYLERMGKPQTPEDLINHDCLMFRVPANGRILPWGFVREGTRFDAPVRTAMVSDDIDVLARLAASGGGVARLAAFVARSYVERGELEEIFVRAPDDSSNQIYAVAEPLDVYISLRDRHELTPKVRAFIDFLVEAIPIEWRIKGAESEKQA
jgi:DNA-binding transcriptional LysR family regulator